MATDCSPAAADLLAALVADTEGASSGHAAPLAVYEEAT